MFAGTCSGTLGLPSLQNQLTVDVLGRTKKKHYHRSLVLILRLSKACTPRSPLLPTYRCFFLSLRSSPGLLDLDREWRAIYFNFY